MTFDIWAHPTKNGWAYMLRSMYVQRAGQQNTSPASIRDHSHAAASFVLCTCYCGISILVTTGPANIEANNSPSICITIFRDDPYLTRWDRDKKSDGQVQWSSVDLSIHFTDSHS